MMISLPWDFFVVILAGADWCTTSRYEGVAVCGMPIGGGGRVGETRMPSGGGGGVEGGSIVEISITFQADIMYIIGYHSISTDQREGIAATTPEQRQNVAHGDAGVRCG